MEGRVDCILLAGGRPRESEELFRLTRGGPKAMLPVGGRPMLERVLAALRDSTSVDRVVVVGLLAAGGDAAAGDVATDELVRAWRSPQVSFEPDRGSFAANLYAGIARLGDSAGTAAGVGPGEARRLLYCGSDIPLIDAGAIDRFVAHSRAHPRADVVAGLVRRTRLEAAYPGVRDLWLRLREGGFIAADVAVFDPVRAPAVREHLVALAPNRKSAWRQARYVGAGLLLRYATGRLTVPGFEAHVRSRFGIDCRVLSDCEPELGLDVDSVAALELCESALSARR